MHAGGIQNNRYKKHKNYHGIAWHCQSINPIPLLHSGCKDLFKQYRIGFIANNNKYLMQ
jgi:hypothetical protein